MTNVVKDLERRVGELEAVDGTRLRQILSLEGRVSALDGADLGTDPLDGAKKCVVTEFRCGMGKLHSRLEKLEDAKVSHDHLIGSWSTRLGDVLSQVTNLEREMAGILERVGHLESRMETVDGFHIVGEEPAFYKRLNALEGLSERVAALEAGLTAPAENFHPPIPADYFETTEKRIGNLERLVGDYPPDPLHPLSLFGFVRQVNGEVQGLKTRLESIRPDLERLSALEAQVMNRITGTLRVHDATLSDMSGRLEQIRPDLERLAALEAQVKDMDEALGKLERGVESMQPKTMMQAMVDLGAAEEVEQRQRKFSALVAEANEWVRKNKHTLALSAVTEALGLFSIPAAPKITQGEQPPRPGKIRFAKYPDPACWKRIQEADDRAAAAGLPRVAPEITLPLSTKPLVEGEVPTEEALSKPVEYVSPEMAKEFDRIFERMAEDMKSLLGTETPDPWRHRSAKMRCRTCMWFVRKGDIPVPQPALGRCRRHAPTMSGYPEVYESDWCGDHKIDEAKA